jgi:branched-chain amino acid transport system permease protein
VHWREQLNGVRSTLSRRFGGNRATTARFLPTRRARLWVALLVVAVLFPVGVDDAYYQTVAGFALIYILLGVGMTFLVGHTGLVHSGFAAFYGIGSYTIAVLATKFGVSFWLALPIAILASALLAVAIGIPAIRVSGLYFVLVTLGFAEVFRLSITNLNYTGGPNGLYGIPAPALGSLRLGSPSRLYWLTLVAVAISFFFFQGLSRSRIGRAWNCLREDEVAAQVLGVNPVWGKLQAAMLAGAWAGLAGAFFAAQQTAVSPGSFTFTESFLVILVVSIGGLRSLQGIVLGTLAIIILPELLRPLAEYRLLVYGIAIVLIMLFRPAGLWPGGNAGHYASLADQILAQQEPVKPNETTSP